MEEIAVAERAEQELSFVGSSPSCQVVRRKEMSLEACSSAETRKELTLGAVSCKGTPPTHPDPTQHPANAGGRGGVGDRGLRSWPAGKGEAGNKRGGTPELRQRHRGVHDPERLPEVCHPYRKDVWRPLT